MYIYMYIYIEIRNNTNHKKLNYNLKNQACLDGKIYRTIN